MGKQTAATSVEGRIVVLGTGGTIAGRAARPDDNIGYSAAEVGVEELLTGAEPSPGITLLTEQVAQVDSKDMAFAIWLALAQRCAHWLAQPDVRGIVVTHGTDTLEETAFFLQRILDPTKPIVLTCAMRPSTSLTPDGPQNLRDAIVVAGATSARGVVAVCAGVIHSAFDVQKVHTYRLDAFSSGEAGPVGYVEEGEARMVRAWPTAPAAAALDACTGAAPRVEILTSHAGATGLVVDALLRDRRSNPDEAVQGLVLAATGNGTLHHDLEAAALRAQSAGLRVVRATRCSNGRILPKAGDTLPDAGGLSPVKARIALMLDLFGTAQSA